MIRILISDYDLEKATELLGYLIYDWDGSDRAMIAEEDWPEAEEILENACIDYDII